MNENLFYRHFDLDRSGLDENNRTLALSFSSEMPVERWFGKEILLHDEGNFDLSRLSKVGAALFNHNPNYIIGPINNARIEGKRGKAEIGFDDDEQGNYALTKVKSKSLKGVSFGYAINKAIEVAENETQEIQGRKIKGPAIVGTKWTAYEISLTPIPADPSVGVGRDVTRSLDGIDIEKSTHNQTLIPFSERQNKEVEEMDREQIMELIRQEFPGMLTESMKGIVPDLVNQVKAALAEDAKPKLRIEVENLTNLLARAGAVSPELKAKVADMAIVEGKTEKEITDTILDAATNYDANKGAGIPGDGTGKGDKKRDANALQTVTSFEQIDDDTFLRSLSQPNLFPVQ